MQNNLKVSKQCAKVVNTANRVSGMIYKTFTYKSRDRILPLYKSCSSSFGLLCTDMV